MSHPIAPGTRGSRVLLAAATVVLVAATHWPDLTIDSAVVRRPDLFIHVFSFWLWTTLLLRARLIRPTAVAIGAALVFVTADELTQHFVPGRTVAWSDWVANASGVGLALLTSPITRAKPAQAGARSEPISGQ